MVEQQEKLWTYQAVGPGQEGQPTAVLVTELDLTSAQF